MGKSLKCTQSIADYMVMVICTISPRGKKKKKKKEGSTQTPADEHLIKNVDEYPIVHQLYPVHG